MASYAGRKNAVRPMLRGSIVSVNTMSPLFFSPLLGSNTFPPHSAECFVSPARQCRQCNDLLGPYPVRRWKEIWLKQQDIDAGLPAALPPRFLERLADAMAKEPEIFAPIVRYLVDFKGVSQ